MTKNFQHDFKRAHEFFKEHVAYFMSPYELKNKIKNEINEINIIDLRDYDSYIDGHIPYAIHVPMESLVEHLVMLEKDKLNILYCYDSFCKMAQKAAITLSEYNYPTTVLTGGYKTWEKMKFETVKTSSNE